MSSQKKLEGMIFDVQSFSVHDGPGCRTTVFLNGCPLSCKWCANPESWTVRPHMMFSELSCQYENGCTVCHGKCKNGALSFNLDNKPVIDWNICKDCESFECVNSCYYNAFKLCAKAYTVDELVQVIKRDSNNWRSNGGVTFSGGEPLLQHEFLHEVLLKCHEVNIHTAIETSACVSSEVFNKIFEDVDFAFIDIKHMDREKHKEQTGVYNDLILKNISNLANSDWNGRLVLRVPVISGFNDSVKNISDIISFMHKNNLVEINLLPFHRLGESKWVQLGKEYEYSDKGDVDEGHLEELQDIFLDNGIACYVGHETAF